MTTDGSLSKDGRHIDLTSKDREQLENFLKAANLKCKIGLKKSGSGNVSFRVQLSNVDLYKFLVSIGLTSNKSKTLKNVEIPNDLFFDFLRGHFDGDGSFYSYTDKRWENSQMYYMCFCSASKDHIEWIRHKINELLKIRGSLVKTAKNSTYQLKFAKKESRILISHLYYNNQVVCLKRKQSKITKVCTGGEMVYTYA